MNDTTIEQLDKYLSGSMSEAEKAAFESRLQTDEALREELELLRRIRASIDYSRNSEQQDHDLAATLQSLKSTYIENKPAGEKTTAAAKKAWNRRTGLGIILFFMLAAAGAYYLFFKRPSCDRLFEKYKNYQAANFTTKSSGGRELTLEKASKAFNTSDYATAERFLRAATSGQESTEPKLLLYLGFCLLEQQKTEDAERIFLQLKEYQSFADEARWYLALTYLSEGQWKKAAGELEKTPVSSRHYQNAADLLNAVRACSD